MTTNEKIIEELKECSLVKSLLLVCIESLKSEEGQDYLDVIFDLVPYEGDNKPDIEKFLEANINFGLEVFSDAEYPEEDTVEMKVITNIQLCLQEQLESY